MTKIKDTLFIFIRKAIYRLLAKLPFLANSKVVVFCYHSISSDYWRYSINSGEFKRQINHLLKTRRPVTADDVLAHIKGDRPITDKSFLVSFDDGYKDIVIVKKFLKSHSIRPIVFVLSEPKKADKMELNTSIGFLNKPEILKLQKLGWTIGCHSATHQNFGRINGKGIRDEVISSKLKLEKDLGIKIKYFAYPKGIYNEGILKAIKKAGYKMAFSMDGGFVTKSTDLFKVPRVGVDKTHTFSEFPATYSTPVLLLRKLLNIVRKI